MTRLALTLLFFLGLSIGVGFLLGGDYFDWWMASGLFALAVAGELLRWWLRRRPRPTGDSTAPKNSARQSSVI
ncbi:hypothetical protein ACI2LF_02760 [Kribbella sp. NPDC020789]